MKKRFLKIGVLLCLMVFIQTLGKLSAQVGTGNNYTPSFIDVTGGGAMPDSTNGLTCNCDGTGVTDATACLQTALDSAYKIGKPLLIPYTAGYYKISDPLRVKTSVMGIQGRPLIAQVDTLAQGMILEDDMTGWIYNIHIKGTYDLVERAAMLYEYAHNIMIAGAHDVTIKNNILELSHGDNIGNSGGAKKMTSNILVTNNALLNASRCGISIDKVVDRMAIMNNYIEWQSQYVDPIDIEPYEDASNVTNIEIGYNDIQSPKPYKLDASHFYEAIIQVTHYWDPTAGGKFFFHHNYGAWGAPFTNVTGYKGAPAEFKTLLFLNNAEGSSVPGTDTQAPSVPAGLTVSDVTSSSLTLTWDVSTDDNAVIGYVVFKDGVILDTTADASIKVSNLTCGTVYPMSVKAYDASGNVSAASVAYKAATSDCGGASTNLLTNPGYENGLTGWDDWGGTALDANLSRSGLYCLKIDSGDGGHGQGIEGLEAGKTYVLSAWGKLIGDGDFYKQDAYIGIEFKDVENIKTYAKAFITDTVNWAQAKVQFTVPEGTVVYTVYVYYEARGITTNSVLVDDWFLKSFEPVTAVNVTPSTLSIDAGIVSQLTASLVPDNATIKNVKWSSSDTLIAKVDSITGSVKAYAQGSATITATSEDGGKTGACEVTVTIGTTNLILNPGIEVDLSTGWTGDWGGGTSKLITTSSHSGKNCLSVGPGDDGRAQELKGLIPGSTYTLSAWCLLSGSGFGPQKSYIGVELVNGTGGKTHITTNPIIATDTWTQYYFTFTLSAEIKKISAYIYQEGGGTTTVNTLTDDWALIAGWAPKEFVAVTGVEVTPATALVAIGATQQLTANVSPLNATDLTVSWTSSDKTIATVSSKGIVKGVKIGNATITATTRDGAFVDVCEVTVGQVGINESAEKAARLYPNPLAIGQLLNIDGVKNAESIAIVDMMGKVVFAKKLQGSDSELVNLNNTVSAGSYIVTIKTSAGSISKLLIVQ